jgi:hypothetical protein
MSAFGGSVAVWSMAPLAMADLSWTISVRVFRSVGAEVYRPRAVMLNRQ